MHTGGSDYKTPGMRMRLSMIIFQPALVRLLSRRFREEF